MAPKSTFHVPRGFAAGGVHSGLKKGKKLDLGMIAAERDAMVVAMTTTNKFPAAPILLVRQMLASSARLRGVVVNSGNANAVTGARGLESARVMARAAADATDNPTGSFLVASTGVIGKALPIDKITAAMPKLAASISAKGFPDFADAIATTDTVKKIVSRRFTDSRGDEYTVLGVAKGSGMIQPDMATMLAFLMTDYPIARGKARHMLGRITEETFNCLTIDGQTSTNDMLTLISSARSIRRMGSEPDDELFADTVEDVSMDLVRLLAADGEGATKAIRVSVCGTNSRLQAKRVGLEVGNSALVKTAVFGEDPNWGRIIQAMGKSGAPFSPENANISIQGASVLRAGEPVEFDRADLKRRMKAKTIEIEIELGSGPGSAEIWTCDLTHGYIDINTDYN